MSTSPQALDALKREIENENREAQKLESILKTQESEVLQLQQKLTQAEKKRDDTKRALDQLRQQKEQRVMELGRMEHELKKELETVKK